jgi:hypothetical protein
VNTHHLIIGADPMGLGAARQLELKVCHALALAGWANLWLYEMTAPSVSSFLDCYLQWHLTRAYRIERPNSLCRDVAARSWYLHIRGLFL